jgi:hypothetical protein
MTNRHGLSMRGERKRFAAGDDGENASFHTSQQPAFFESIERWEQLLTAQVPDANQAGQRPRLWP